MRESAEASPCVEECERGNEIKTNNARAAKPRARRESSHRRWQGADTRTPPQAGRVKNKTKRPCAQNNANNAMNFSASPGNNFKSNYFVCVVFYDCQPEALTRKTMREYVTIEQMEEAYRLCKKHKGRSKGCIEYSRDWVANNFELWQELNSMTYEVGASKAFCISYPTYREVFCAKFRDRVVQALVCHHFEGILESYMPNDCYACRKGKGTLYGVNRIREQIERISENYTKETWVWKGDIKGFFMSVDRLKAYKLVEQVVRKDYTGENMEWWLWLWKLILLNAPEKNCRRTGDLNLWAHIPQEKSLFTNGEGRGLAIGNLPSHIIANLLLSTIIGTVLKELRMQGGGGGWYVDDTVLIHRDKKLLLKAVGKLRMALKANGYKLHPRKFYLQEARKGVSFVGSTIKPGRMYPSERTTKNLFRLITRYNRGEVEKQDFVNSYNSYMGSLVHRSAYGMRWRAWKAIEDKQGLCSVRMRKLNVYNVE